MIKKARKKRRKNGSTKIDVLNCITLHGKIRSYKNPLWDKLQTLREKMRYWINIPLIWWFAQFRPIHCYTFYVNFYIIHFEHWKKKTTPLKISSREREKKTYESNWRRLEKCQQMWTEFTRISIGMHFRWHFGIFFISNIKFNSEIAVQLFLFCFFFVILYALNTNSRFCNWIWRREQENKMLFQMNFRMVYFFGKVVNIQFQSIAQYLQ